MKSLLALAVLIAISPAFAAGPVKKTKRTLKDVVDLALKDGKDAAVPAEMAAKLGLSKEAQPTRKLRYKAADSPDHLDHAFEVLVAKDKDGNLAPQNLILTTVLAKAVGDTHELDGNVYKASMQGKLLKACHNHGTSGHVTADELKLTRDAKAQFTRDLNFFLNEAADIQPVK